MFGTKTMASISTVLMMMLAAGFVAADDINHDREISTEIVTGSTDRMGGGDWIAIRSGDIIFAVIYGTDENPNEIILLTEQKRYLGGADVYSTDEDLLKMQGIPVNLIFAQKLKAMVEYIDVNGDGLFDLRWMDNMTALPDRPVKSASLNVAWELNDLSVITNDDETLVNFALTATDIPYNWVWHMNDTDMMGGMMRMGNVADGVVEQVTFSFHMRLAIENKTVQMVPWYRVEVDNGKIVGSEFLEYRNYTSDAINGTIKYDHYIEGWDFESNESMLAVETTVLAGIHTSSRVNQWFRERHTVMNCEMNGTAVVSEDISGSESPLLSRDTLRFNDNWEGFGRLSWISDVEVDNRTEQMMFQIQNGGALSIWHRGHHFTGFMVRAAYLYPAGDVIYHDPIFASTTSTIDIDETANAFPNLIGFIQLGAVIIAAAFAIALSLFLRKRGSGGENRINKRLPEGGQMKQPKPIEPPQPPWRKDQ